MEPDQGPFRPPLRRRAQPLGIGGQSEALEAAPAVADAEMDETVDQPRAVGIAAAVQHEGEEAGRAGEIALPDFMAGTVREGGMEDPRHLLLILQPSRDL